MAHNRVMQWSTMARTWWLYDAYHQSAFHSAVRITRFLQGQHKPVYHPLSDIGDHVVVINTSDIAMKDDYWRKFRYFHHTRYPGGFSVTSAWRLHEMDPTKVLYKAVNSRLPGNLLRPNMMRRLHLYADDNVPDEIMDNVSDQIQQLRQVPTRLDQYTDQEIANFPKVFDWPEEHVINLGQKTKKSFID